MDPSVHLKLGGAYQDDQHLRDVLLNACRTEKLAHRLAKMPMSCLLDVEESLAKSLSAEEIFNMPKPSQPSPKSTAFDPIAPHSVNFSQRTGMSYRTYKTDKMKFHEAISSVGVEKIERLMERIQLLILNVFLASSVFQKTTFSSNVRNKHQQNEINF